MRRVSTSLARQLMLIGLLVTLGACADGADGTNGQDGVNGMDGANGMNGTNGQDGVNGMDGMNGADGKDGASGYPRATFYVAKNGAANAGTIERVNESLTLTRSWSSGNNEGVAFSANGELVQAGDGAMIVANLRTICPPSMLTQGATAAPERMRELRGANTQLVAPKGIALAHKAGLIFVADAMSPNVRVFGSAAAGDVPPVASTTLPGNAWDLAYDEVNDRLFVALTNGTITVHDRYVQDGFGQAAHTITPANAVAAKISVNLHGIVYDRGSDRLVVSDVGNAASATDGQIFVINAASSADGNVPVARTIVGPATGLGNPVDIELTGTDLHVAEKANDTLLIFSDIFAGPSGDIAPSLSVPSTKPESLAMVDMSARHRVDISDIDTNTMSTPYLSVSSNPAAGQPTTGRYIRYSSTLNATITDFNTNLRIESVSFDTQGDAYVTYDDGSDTNGGIFIAGRGAQGRDGGEADVSMDRMITGAATGLVAPKGLDISSEHGLIFVAENNATTPGVLVFSTCASGDVAPLFRIDAGGRPWDVDFDAATGRLFVALTNGDVAVFDQVLADQGANGSDRTITPADSNAKASINLHGIDYDPATDSLLLSDVGSAASATDGQIFVIPGASAASGLAQVSVRIQGPANPNVINPNNTQLGNPVDIAYQGHRTMI